MTANQLEGLLTKPIWDYHDVQDYCGCGSSKAYEIIEDLRGSDPYHKKSGWVDNFPKHVKRDAILSYFATDAKTEMGIAIIARVATSFLRNLAMVEEARNGGI